MTIDGLVGDGGLNEKHEMQYVQALLNIPLEDSREEALTSGREIGGEAVVSGPPVALDFQCQVDEAESLLRGRVASHKAESLLTRPSHF
jgi:hypothetical protein